MSKIRKLYYFDKKKMQEMISFLNNRDVYVEHIMFNPLVPLHHMLPIKLKYLPESYILKDKKDIKGLITVAPFDNSIPRMEIQRLFFEENSYDDAVELIQYAVSKYKAMGAISFIVKVDDNLPELLRIFVSKCDFSQISYEKLWQIPVRHQEKIKYSNIRHFRNSDAKTVASLYNESLLPHIRPLLSSSAKEFKEPIFKGLSYYNEYKFVIEDKKTNNISAYLSIKTVDNKNYVLDIIQSSWVDIDINTIIDFGMYQVQKRQKDFNLFIKIKKYTQLGAKYEQMAIEHKFLCTQSQIVLTNSSARIIKENISTGKFTVLSPFYNSGINVPG